MATYRELAAAVLSHANRNWGFHGWDYIAECKSVEEITEELESLGTTDIRMCIAHYAEQARIWDDQRREVRSAGEW